MYFYRLLLFFYNFGILKIIIFLILNQFCLMGIGDWGLGIGPNPQCPIPNPQSPIPKNNFLKIISLN